MLKKVLIGLVALVLIAIPVILIAPSLIDWNAYKARITSELAQATGRDVTIDGDLSLTLIPQPALSVDRVRLGNLDGGSRADMIRMGSMRINLQVAPLLSGQLVFDSIVLQQPDILLERLPDGRENWVFAGSEPLEDITAGGDTPSASGEIPPAEGQPAPAEAQPAPGEAQAETTQAPAPQPTNTPAPSPSSSSEGDAPLDIRIGAITIQEGRVVYLDGQSGTTETLENISLNVSADSLYGPFRVSGRMEARLVEFVLEGALGLLEPGKASQVSLGLSVPEGDSQIVFKGLLSDFTAGLTARGTLSLDSASPAATIGQVMAALGDAPESLPAPLSEAGSLSGQFEVSETAVRWWDLDGAVGGTTVGGELALTLSDIPDVKLALSLGEVDGAAWTTAQALPAPGDQSHQFASWLNALGVRDAQAQTPPPVDPQAFAIPPLPTDVIASVDLSVAQVLWNGEPLRDVMLSAALANGEVTINQMSAQLPGVSDFSIYGFILPQNGVPTADLSLSAQSGNLRGLLSWAGVDLSQVPADRLRILSLSGQIQGDPTQIQISNVDLTLDTTKARAAATLRPPLQPGARLGVGLTLIVDTLNADAYLPPSDGAASQGQPAPGGGGQFGQQIAQATEGAAPAEAAPAAGAPPGPLLAGLEALNDFDASFDLSVGTLVANNLEIRDAKAKGSLVNGRLTLTETGFSDVLGIAAALSADIGGFGGEPQLHGITYDIKSGSLDRAAYHFGLDLPLSPADLGAVHLVGTLSGSLDALNTNGTVNAAGGRVAHNGVVQGVMGDALGYNLNIDLSHPDAVRAIRYVSPDYTPGGGALGALQFNGQVVGAPNSIDVFDMRVVIGSNDAAGSLSLRTGGPKPDITADLTSGSLNLDSLLPADQAASLPSEETPRIRKASLKPWELLTAPPAYFQRAAMELVPQLDQGRLQDADRRPAEPAVFDWSTAPIDLSALDTANANISLKAGRLIVQGLPLDQADIQASLQDSVLDVSRLNGALYGGALGGTARVVGGGAPQYNLNVGLNNWQISNFLSAYGGAAEALGNGNANLAVSSGGLSVLDIVRALNGNGGLQINGFDVAVGNGAVQGNVLAGVLGLVANLNQVTSFGQGRGVADLSGSFSVQNGVIAFDPFQIISQFYEGALSGRISLVDWTLDANGSAKLAKTALAGVLGNVVKLPDDLPFSVSGSLDNPQFTIATLPRPEDLAKENIPQVLEQVVPNLIPGGDSAPKIEVPQEAEQLLRGLFGR